LSFFVLTPPFFWLAGTFSHVPTHLSARDTKRALALFFFFGVSVNTFSPPPRHAFPCEVSSCFSRHCLDCFISILLIPTSIWRFCVCLPPFPKRPPPPFLPYFFSCLSFLFPLDPKYIFFFLTPPREHVFFPISTLLSPPSPIF